MHTIRNTALGLVLALAAAPVLAYQCPGLVKKVDAALEQGSGLGEAQLARVKELRAEGARLHKAGQHGASVAKLSEALEILGR